MSADVRYRFEYEERLRCAFIGADGHSFRSIYPALQYAPVDLVAVCDTDGSRAHEYARLFGGSSAYTDHREMLDAERPDAVFVVTAYEPDGEVQATALAEDCLRAGRGCGWRSRRQPGWHSSTGSRPCPPRPGGRPRSRCGTTSSIRRRC